MGKAKRARKVETPKQPSLRLRPSALYFHPKRRDYTRQPPITFSYSNVDLIDTAICREAAKFYNGQECN